MICGLGGNDTLLGGRGNDILVGGPGRDLLRGGSGKDRLLGDSGRDELRGERGDDRLDGGSGSDLVQGGAGGDRLVGGPGRDTLRGRRGPDMVLSGADTMADQVRCGPGPDRAVADLRDDVNSSCETIDRGEEEPATLDLDTTKVAENQPAGTVAGRLTTSLQGATFSLVAGDGSQDNSSFTVDGQILRTSEVFDHESAPTLQIRLKAASVSKSITSALTIIVTDVNEAPTTVRDTYATAEDAELRVGASGSPSSLTGNDTDPEGDALSLVSISDATGGTASLERGVVTFVPRPNACGRGAGAFSYLVPDGTNRATGSASIDVTCVGDATLAAADTATLTEDDPATTIDVLANDTDADITSGNNTGQGSISIVSVTQPTNGTVTIIADGTRVTYEPNANYCNSGRRRVTDDFTYTASDGSGDSGTATVKAAVDCVPDPTIAVDDTATLTEDDPATTIDVLANDTDGDTAGGRGSIVIDQVTQPAHGLVDVTENGTRVTYEPDADYCNTFTGGASDSFSYTATSDLGEPDTAGSAEVTILLTCVGDATTAVDDAVTVTEDDEATTIDVLANDTDVDPGPIGLASITQPEHGTATIIRGSAPAIDEVTYEPDADYCNTEPGATADNFTYTAEGGGTATVRVTVTCVPDPTISELSASSAHAGSTITISGSDFSSDRSDITVRFGTTSATVTAASPTSLTVVVPAGLTGSQPVTVTNAGATSPAKPFSLINPAVTTTSTTSGSIGSSVVINGSGFSATAADNVVRFGTVTATVTAASTTSLTVTVPAGTSGAVPVTVRVLQSETAAAGNYAVKPTITSTAPTSGGTGATVTITGTGFKSGATVQFGSTTVPANSVTVDSNTQLSVPVPAGLTNGTIAVTVTVGTQTSTASTFTVANPALTSLSSNTGCTGNSVTLTGSNFSSTPANNDVRFGTVAATVTAASATSLTVTVPTGVAATSTVTVKVNGAQAAGSATYTLGFSAPVMHVAAGATGSGDGSSWTNAYPTLSAALAATSYCGTPEIWVKTGTYNPGAARTATFSIDKRPVFGGFAGTETARSQRDWAANPTILTGDVNGDDDYTNVPATNITDNNLHVVTSNGALTLDGVIIRGGNANQAVNSTYDYYGGGLFANGGPIAIKNTIFEANNSYFGGSGVASIEDTTTTYENTVFYRNSGANNGNVAVYESGGTHTYNNVLIANNNAGVRAVVTRGNTIFNQVSLVNNISGVSSDGQTFFVESGTLTMNNSIVWGNTTGNGCNGIRAASGTTLTMRNTLSQVAPAGITCTAGATVTTTNITTTNPSFLSTIPKGLDGRFFTNDDGYQLTAASTAALDNGDDALVPSTLTLDITGSKNRIIGTHVDRGAYERE